MSQQTETATMTTSQTPSVSRRIAARMPTSAGGMMARALDYLDDRKEMKRFSKFAIVGVMGFVIDFTVSNLLWVFLPENFAVPMPFGLEPISYIGFGGSMGFIAAVASNFVWNRYWTYPESRSKSVISQVLMFFGINIAGYIIRILILENITESVIAFLASLTGLMEFAINILSPVVGNVSSAGVALWAGKNVTLAISVILVMLWNFFVNRYLTYNDVDNDEPDSENA